MKKNNKTKAVAELQKKLEKEGGWKPTGFIDKDKVPNFKPPKKKQK